MDRARSVSTLGTGVVQRGARHQIVEEPEHGPPLRVSLQPIHRRQDSPRIGSDARHRGGQHHPSRKASIPSLPALLGIEKSVAGSGVARLQA